MKTLKAFVENTHLDEQLVRAVVRQAGGWDSFKESAEDIANHGADAGFSGFIYCSDTVAFEERNHKLIYALASEMASEFGSGSTYEFIGSFNCLKLSADEVVHALHTRGSDDATQVRNALTWFALEEVARSYVDCVDR